MIQGITVELLERIQTGTDGFNRPVYSEVTTPVKNILVYPAASEDIISEQNLNGKHLEYYLCVPKDDAHVWTDQRVRFFGETWTVYSFPEEWIDTNNPSVWNKRYKCERYSK
jgi:hypothetical protein